jgi:hypothetical protein
VITTQPAATPTPTITPTATPTPTPVPTPTAEPIEEPVVPAPIEVPVEEPPVVETPAPEPVEPPRTNTMDFLPENPAGCSVVFVDSPSLGLPVRWSQYGTVNDELQGLADQLGLNALYEIDYENCREAGYIGMGTLGTYCTVSVVIYPGMTPDGHYELEVYRTDTNEYVKPNENDPSILREYLIGFEFGCEIPDGGLGIA